MHRKAQAIQNKQWTRTIPNSLHIANHWRMVSMGSFDFQVKYPHSGSDCGDKNRTNEAIEHAHFVALGRGGKSGEGEERE